MSDQHRLQWERHIDQVLRSKHYTWLAEGLAGAPPETALTDLLTDIMHICEREGISFEGLAARSRAQFEREEAESAEPCTL